TAVRLSAQGRSLVYSADSGESEELVGLAAGANLFLCEATLTAEEQAPPGLHLNAQQAGEHAARAGVERLLVTHVPPWVSRERQAFDAAAAFGADVSAAAPDASYEI